MSFDVHLRAVKGVNFFGLQSEYVVSGSDCGHIFLWDKNTEEIVQFMDGDYEGVVSVYSHDQIYIYILCVCV